MKKLIVAAMAALSFNAVADFNTSDELVFGAEVPKICGIHIQKNNGTIDFDGDDKAGERDHVSFVVRQNGRYDAKVTLDTKSVTDGMDESLITYEVEMDGKEFDYTDTFTVGRKKVVEVEAEYAGNYEDVIAGEARIITDVTVQCFDNPVN